MVAAELVIWWAVAVGLWMASLSAYSGHELLLAIALGLPAAVAAVAARRAVKGSWSVSRDVLRWLLVLPVAVVTDAARVLALPLLRPHRVGGLRWLDVKARGETSAATGRRALSTLFLAATPGSYVIAADEAAGSLLIHTIGNPNLVEKAIRR